MQASQVNFDPDLGGKFGGSSFSSEYFKEIVESWETPEDAVAFAKQIGLTTDQLTNSNFLQSEAGLPKSKGGIGIRLHLLASAIRERFKDWGKFGLWMGKYSKRFSDVVNSWEKPQDALDLAKRLGITKDQLKNTAWLMNKARLPEEQGGINRNLKQLYRAIKSRFGDPGKFEEWLEGEPPAKSIRQIVEAWETPKDARRYADQIGISVEQLKSYRFLRRDSQLPKKKGGINTNLQPLLGAIEAVYGGIRKFGAWMEGVQDTTLFTTRVASWETPQDAIDYAKDLGITLEQLCSYNFLVCTAKLPKEQGGIGRNLSGLYAAIKKHHDNEFANFVPWVTNTEKKLTAVEIVASWQIPGQAIDFAHSIGITKEQLANTKFLTQDSKLPVEKGGIGYSLSGYYEGIMQRFVTFSSFQEWLDQDDFSEELSEAVALLANDPRVFLRYLRIFHPELSITESNRIALQSFVGLNGSQEHKDYSAYKIDLEQPLITSEIPVSTDENSLRLEGKVNENVSHVLIRGAFNTKIRPDNEGRFSFHLPIPKAGDINKYDVCSVNEEEEKISEPTEIDILHTGKPYDPEAAFEHMIVTREKALSDIKKDPHRYNYLVNQLELSLLGKFTESEARGFRHLESRIKNEKSPTRKKMLVATLNLFRHISEVDYGIQPGEDLYFFQKYKVYKLLQAIENGEPGKIDASEQGLGKTATALALASNFHTTVICPNAVVTTWQSEERKFCKMPHLTALEGPYKERDQLLRDWDHSGLVTNVEYTREISKIRREGLSREDGILIIDEADYLGSKSSQQAVGSNEICAAFRLLLTATPFKRISQIGTMLGVLDPTDKRFADTQQFSRAFPSSNPRALDALHILMEERTIRITKGDVFKTFDPDVPLEKQKDRLPTKNKISPEEMGEYELNMAQCESIYELLTNYQLWCRKHKGHETFVDRQYSRYKEGFFPKREAIRQIMNSPAYFGRPRMSSPKHKKMFEIVEHELSVEGNKVLIFCRYKEQVAAYQELFEEYGFRAYYGDTPSDSDGFKVNDDGERLLYQVDESGEFVLNDEGIPIELPLTDADGQPMKALDYEKIVFQNCDDARGMIATYDAGAVGVTFTAAHAVIFDDLAPTYRDEYQAGDRAHRIDNLRKKYEVRYYWLKAKYPDRFLNQMRKRDSDYKFFKNGTYDEIVFDHIRWQEKVFHKIMDLIGSDDVIENENYLKKRMPFLFEQNGDSNES